MNIFIKTCEKDIPWLRYCLESIHRYGPQHKVTVVCDESGKDAISKINTIGATIHFVPDHWNGYVYQQIIKLEAYKYVEDDLILYVDSDCVFFKEFSIDNFMHEGKPLLLKTRYGNLGNGEIWKSITERYVNFDVDWEYMRRLPLIIRKDTLIKLHERYPNLISILNDLKTKEFSEFNVIGAFIDRYQANDYSIVDTEIYLPEKVAEQFWSWGGVTKEVEDKIKEFFHL